MRHIHGLADIEPALVGQYQTPLPVEVATAVFCHGSPHGAASRKSSSEGNQFAQPAPANARQGTEDADRTASVGDTLTAAGEGEEHPPPYSQSARNTSDEGVKLGGEDVQDATTHGTDDAAGDGSHVIGKAMGVRFDAPPGSDSACDAARTGIHESGPLDVALSAGIGNPNPPKLGENAAESAAVQAEAGKPASDLDVPVSTCSEADAIDSALNAGEKVCKANASAAATSGPDANEYKEPPVGLAWEKDVLLESPTQSSLPGTTMHAQQLPPHVGSEVPGDASTGEVYLQCTDPHSMLRCLS